MKEGFLIRPIFTFAYIISIWSMLVSYFIYTPVKI